MTNILEFDKRIFSKNEIIFNINYYKENSSNGLKYLSERNYKEANRILKTLKKSLKKEFKYYKNIQNIIRYNKIYNTYYWMILLAYHRANKVYLKNNTYQKLFGIWDSLTNYDLYIFL